MNNNRDRIRIVLSLALFLVIILLPSTHSPILAADESLSFTSNQPPDAFENEDYSWNLVFKGGKTPFICTVTGSLPPGLLFDSANCAITGKPTRGNASDKYTFDIKVSDSSSPILTATARVTMLLRYRSNVSISSSLSEGEATIYADGQKTEKVKGGQKISLIFPAGTKHTISTDLLVTTPNNDTIRFVPAIEKVIVDGNSPDANFDFVPEYNIRVKSNMMDMPPLPGSAWYKPNAILDVTALATFDPKSGTQYRFSHWLLPTGEVSGSRTLNWKVSKQGDAVATYDTYYQLTANSEHCSVEGIGWFKAGTKATWTIKCSESIPSTDFWGSLGVELKPEKVTGTVVMDAPREIVINWKPDYTRIIIQITFGLIGGLMFVLVGFFQGTIKRLITRIRK